MEVASRFPDRIVLGADTVVSSRGRSSENRRILHEARAMLERLCGRIHEVLTGVCLVQRSERKALPLRGIHAGEVSFAAGS